MVSDLVKKLLESIERPAFIKNNLGTYIECNASFVRLLGLEKGHILSSTAFNIFPNQLAQTYAAADAELFARRSVQIYRAPIQGVRQTQESVIFSKTIFFDDRDNIGGFICTINTPKESCEPAMSGGKSNPSTPDLTRREFEVLCLIAKGLSTKEVARVLMISNHTVSDYLKALYVKLGVNNRVEVVIAAQKLGLI